MTFSIFFRFCTWGTFFRKSGFWPLWNFKNQLWEFEPMDWPLVEFYEFLWYPSTFKNFRINSTNSLELVFFYSTFFFFFCKKWLFWHACRAWPPIPTFWSRTLTCVVIEPWRFEFWKHLIKRFQKNITCRHFAPTIISL